MSGGAYNYASFQLDRFIKEFEKSLKNDSRRIMFNSLLKLVSKAIHEIEWVDSGDCSPGDEYKSIDKVFDFIGGDRLEQKYKSEAFDAFVTIIEGMKKNMEIGND